MLLVREKQIMKRGEKLSRGESRKRKKSEMVREKKSRNIW
jgi:hypothetical protein